MQHKSISENDHALCHHDFVHFCQQEKILIAAVCVSYVVSQDALFIESHTLFDLDLIADHRLTDHHTTRNVDVVPDVRVV